MSNEYSLGHAFALIDVILVFSLAPGRLAYLPDDFPTFFYYSYSLLCLMYEEE